MFTPTTILTETIEGVPQHHAWGQKAPEQLPSHKTGEQLIKWLPYLHLPPFYLNRLLHRFHVHSLTLPQHTYILMTHTLLLCLLSILIA
jgi:hypothetical protein